MLTVSETAKAAGISVRTLHYYDEIGLLSPAIIEENGYRYYDDASLERLQQIFFYRELDFPLTQIGEILSDPDYDRKKALAGQRELLSLKIERLERLVSLVDDSLKGETNVSFKEFNMDEINAAKEKYADEAKERWGGSDAYAESERRTKGYTPADWERISNQSNEIYSGFHALVGGDPSSEEAQQLVERWKQLISDNFYPCSDEILAGLGEMYAADERFQKSIDQAGEGTALFMSRAIKAYTDR